MRRSLLIQYPVTKEKVHNFPLDGEIERPRIFFKGSKAFSILFLMIDIATARALALSLPSVEEKDHFGMPSFRVKNKIFATLWVKENRAMVKLSPIDQSVFCAYDNRVFFPVPGKWGLKGATFVELKKVKKNMFKDALTTAYCGVAPKPLAEKYLKK